MNVSRTARRLATAGVATALAAGALVGAASTTATAAEATTTYTCQFLTGAAPVDVTVSAPALDAVSEIDAGKFVPAEFLNLGGDHAVDITVKLPVPVASALGMLGGISAISSPDLGMVFGSTTVPVDGLALAPNGLTMNQDGTATVTATGTNGAFSVPEAGDHDIMMPSDFTMVPTTGTAGPMNIPCHSAAPASLKSITVNKTGSATAVKAPATVKKGKVAKLVATVSGGFTTPSGKVVFKDGSKKLGTATLNDAGKAVLKAKGLKVGKHSVTAKYAGDGYRTASKSGAVKFKVVK